jgi:hypothetical protein
MRNAIDMTFPSLDTAEMIKNYLRNQGLISVDNDGFSKARLGSITA